ncbi:dienelactone hydrolase family protein [Pseudonocardia eucalypti]|uniref:Dienelactone hydrolase family protein n=1 Tax=Pseudonocardia eucalypti TaxID=648755 RepID=A0ABP9RBF7_9PSEU|nr:carboxymethylenebutenolidase [Pseudonocardia eucalypti]
MIESELTRVGELTAYLSRPAGGSAAGMLLLPMITGLGAQLRAYADDIARAGVTALAWDPWHGPTGDDHDREQLTELMADLSDDRALPEQAQLLDHLYGPLGVQRAGVIGWCLGGRYAFLLAAREPRLASCVAYHPTVPAEAPANRPEDAVAAAGRITCPVLMIYPGADHLVPASTFRALRDALDGRESGPSLIQVYPGAGHGFMEAGRREDPVNAAATRLSWPQALGFIRVTTGG